ncbi:MAG: ABC transporter permease [Hyphomicrobiales bacterium]|nr:ABC transporter permease [Hyphomicrobiales bacterium]
MSAVLPERNRRLRIGKLPASLLIGGTILVAWLLLAIFADIVAPYSPIGQDVPSALQPPSLAHLLGTDNYGRDILSRIIHGARIDLQIGLFGVLFPFLIGNVIGLIAGYFGGWVDNVLMRILEVTIAFPFFVLVIAIISILGPGLMSLYIALALVGWVSYARLTRARVLVLKGDDFVGAARVLGYSNSRIMLRHLLPNVISAAVVFAMTDMVLVILLGSSLSYLGLGAQPPAAEWGVMIAEGQQFLSTAWWICFFPGLAIVLLALGLSLSADGLAGLLGTKT